MAFHQPTRHSMQRITRTEIEERNVHGPQLQDPVERSPQESQSWVLFSPATDFTTTSYLGETEKSVGTPAGSRTEGLRGPSPVARSSRDSESLFSAIDDEDDAELDSLDSHLPEFRSLPGVYALSQQATQQQHTSPILPAHDGLGSFRLDQPVLGTDAQDRIYQFERFNPRRLHRRRESYDRAQLELDYEQNQVAEKRWRIEAWRLEHSRILLEEVQKETRRRRQSQSQSASRPSPLQVSETVLRGNGNEIDADSDGMTWHDEESTHRDLDDDEGILAKITRKVIKDILVIDDRLLSILFGEAIPDEDELSTTPRASSHMAHASHTTADEDSWQLRVLDRVSTELGLLVNQLSQHPGAFSTYTRMQQMPLPYAGLPIIPESGGMTAASAERASNEQIPQPSIPEFLPTIDVSTKPVNIRSRRVDSSIDLRDETGKGNTFTKEEWEQDLDIKLVFRYLRSRFTSRWSNPSTTNTSHLATSSTQDTAAKAARVRQHHPLTARARPTERRTFKATTPNSPAALRHHSSCASQSTRRSARRSSVSSRHYWDIGGSLGTDSVIASAGPMGSWGEV